MYFLMLIVQHNTKRCTKQHKGNFKHKHLHITNQNLDLEEHLFILDMCDILTIHIKSSTDGSLNPLLSLL